MKDKLLLFLSFKMVSLVVSIFLKIANRNRDTCINFKMLNINLI